MWLLRLDAAGAQQDGADLGCGAKAESLRGLLAAGLPVPPGFVVTHAAFRAAVGEAALRVDVDALGQALEQLASVIEAAELPAELEELVTRQAAELAGAAGSGGLLAVRSSISLEDRAAGAAAGVFSSKVAVTPSEVWPAIRAVWASVCTPLAAAYAQQRARSVSQGQAGAAAAPLQVAVIVQRYAPGQRITVYTRQPGQPSSPLAAAERGAELATVPRSVGEAAADASARPQASEPWATAAVALALRAERALALQATGADVELIEGPDGTLAVVQARPIVNPTFTAKLAPPPIVTAALLADGRCWTADLAHNPDPLSPAQAGLVERVDREGASPYALRLCAGYLYVTPRAPQGKEAAPDAEAAPRSAQELRQRFAAIEARAAAALGPPTSDDLAATVAAYVRLVRVWAHEMSPLVSAARRAAGPAFAPPGARPAAVEARLWACARGELSERDLLAQVGELSAAWDVAAPTLAETPGHLAAAVERLRAQQRVASPAQAPAPRADTATTAPVSPARAAQAELGQAAADLAELDDHWFARAQARVRRALVAAGARLELGDDIFWIPLEDAVTAAAAGAVNVDSARAQAGAARAAHRRASAWRMPASVGCGVPAASARWHGVGCGGVVRGRVRQVSELWRLWDGTSMLPAAMTPVVAVVPAVTPALAVALVGAAAIVSETGGLLDHGAAMARELGIPCVVGCTDAMSLPAHALVEVDGEAGVVRVLDES